MGRFNVRKAGTTNGGVDNPGFEPPQSYTPTMDGPVPPGSGTPFVNPKRERNSFCTLTLEALPRVDYYKNNQESAKRPSLGELHGEPRIIREENEDEDKDDKKSQESMGGGHGVKLGWIQGVLIPCLLNIWGVMLFLRLSWVVSQSGILESLIIIGISALVCVLTTLSLSAISTNGEVKGGGVYYIISRSLGPEFGASVGLILAFANAVAASMNTIGFCDSLNSLLRENGLSIIDNGVNDTRIVGVVAIFIMTIICAVGMEWESKAQNVLVVVILGAIVNFLAGAGIGPKSQLEEAKGFDGFSLDNLKNNWGSDYRITDGVEQNVFTVFAIFFPSVTGIQAGANISGDLKDPADAIPKGTLLALGLSMFSYGLFVLFAGGAAIRDASGDIAQLANHTLTDCVSNLTCKYGLHNDYTIMQLMSGWAPLIYAGCFAATISTALTNLLSVPRLIQALGIDHIYPGLEFFSKGYGKANEPYRGYVLTFIISSLFVLIADLNLIAPLISNFYLASYALINFCTFHAALIKALGWRPTFKYYNMWLSLFGFFLCVVIMFLIDWKTSLITFAVFFILYVLVVYRKPDANWGSSTQHQLYKTALMTVQRLAHSREHVKNYSPQVLALTGPIQNRPALLDLANLITKQHSLLMCADISKDKIMYKRKIAQQEAGYEWLGEKKIKGFYSIVDGHKKEDAAQILMKATGLGRLKPNVLLMGYKSNWQTCPYEDLNSYFTILHDAFANRLAVSILRLSGGLDYYSSFQQPDTILEEASNLSLSGSMMDLSASSLNLNDSGKLNVLSPSVLCQNSLVITNNQKAPHVSTVFQTQSSLDLSNPTEMLKAKKKNKTNNIIHKFPDGQTLHKDALENMKIFDKKYKEGIIDVWWLYDDGGLTILLPYILSTRSTFSNCEMRIFALANRNKDLAAEQQSMSTLLSKFRIKYKSLTMINDIMDPPQEGTVKFFTDLLSDYTNPNNARGFTVTNDELDTLKEKTDRQLRLRELVQKHSRESTLVVMSMPMPRKGVVSAPVYMAWLEAITRDMPPFLLVRGNQQSVLTFYS